MITEYIRYRIDPAAAEEFEAAYGKAAAPLAASEHCLDYELRRCHEEPERYVLRITWDSLEGHLSGFRGSAEFRAFVEHVRPYVGAIEEMRHYEATGIAGTGGVADSPPPTLYEWAGGQDALERLFVAFYDKVLGDELLRPLFARMDREHPQHVAAWVGEVLGGPPAYSERLGGHPEMIRHHLGKAITEAQRRRWVDLLVDAADEVGLPDDAEFRAAFMGYVEWGTRLAKLFSQPGATPALDEPVPKWTWAMPPWQDGE